jgi:hypothetical protein
MKKNILCLILAVFLTAACAQYQNAVPVPTDNGNDLYCETVEIPANLKCPNPEGTPPPPVNINITGGGSPSMTVAPPFICVKQGEVVEFRINGPASGPHAILPGTVTVVPKNSGSSWLTGTNYPNQQEINITVPDWLPDDTDYDYRVFTASGVCVDPRIHVW